MNIIISLSFIASFILLNLIFKRYFKLKLKFLELNFFIAFFSIFSSIIFYLVVFKVELLIIKLFIYFVFFILIIILFLNFHWINQNLRNNKFHYKLSDIFIHFYLLIGFLYINLPIIDTDSLRYHLLIGKKILNNDFYNNVTLDYIYIGNSEIISFIGQLFEFKQLISLFNFFGLILVYCMNKDLKENYNFGYGNISTIIIYSLFLLLSNLYSQKMYFILCVITVYSSVYLLHQKNINFLQGVFFFLVNFFVLLSKQSFLFFFILNYSLILFKLQKSNVLKFMIVSSFIIIAQYLPNMYFKFLLFKEPFLPFIMVKNDEILKNFLNYVFNYGTNITDLLNFEFYQKMVNLKNLLSPTNAPFGFALLTLLFSFKSKRKFTYLLLSFIIFIFLTGNIQMRWFLPAVILSSLIFNIKSEKFNKIFNCAIVFQKIIVLSIMFFYVSNYYYDKNNYLSKYYFAYDLLKKINKYPNSTKLISDLEVDYNLNNHLSIYKIYTFKNLSQKNIFFHLEKNQNYLLISRDDIKIENFFNNYRNILTIKKNKKYSIYTNYRNPFVKDYLIYNFIEFKVN